MKTSGYQNLVTDEDARYLYYKHGPLARVEIGQDMVQGIDYYYSLQGWLKGINTPASRDASKRVTADPGSDAFTLSSFNPNTYVGQDEFSEALAYYDGDYNPLGTNVNLGAAANSVLFPAAAPGTGGPPPFQGDEDQAAPRSLYNGNISQTVYQQQSLYNQLQNTINPQLATASLKTDNYSLRRNVYYYDQLNRMVNSWAFLGGPANSWQRVTNNGILPFDATYSYDYNGNILTGQVNSHRYLMDDLTYTYFPGTNRLRYVKDNAGVKEGTDLGNQLKGVANPVPPTFSNYRYDSTGNLTGDASQYIDTIQWTAAGKMRSIRKHYVAANGTLNSDMEFRYDGGGNRYMKLRKPRTAAGLQNATYWDYTLYLRDASGNVMATYTDIINGTASPAANTTIPFTLGDLHLYGATRLGVNTRNDNLYYNRRQGNKKYELTDHLGNVDVLLSDIKKGTDTDGDNAANYYTSTPMDITDYYPFGMPMVGRAYNNTYRYGFNGKENDNEVEGVGNSLDFGARIYDPRLGRWMSVDLLKAKYAYASPYIGMGNKPTIYIDIDGNDTWFYSKTGKFLGATIENLPDAVTVIDELTFDLHTMMGEAITENKIKDLRKSGFSYNLEQIYNNSEKYSQRGENERAASLYPDNDNLLIPTEFQEASRPDHFSMDEVGELKEKVGKRIWSLSISGMHYHPGSATGPSPNDVFSSLLPGVDAPKIVIDAEGNSWFYYSNYIYQTGQSENRNTKDWMTDLASSMQRDVNAQFQYIFKFNYVNGKRPSLGVRKSVVRPKFVKAHDSNYSDK